MTDSSSTAPSSRVNAAGPLHRVDAAGLLHRVDAATLMRIGSLQLRAKAVVEGFVSGLHRSPHHGFSAEFSEYRDYVPGDDVRYLDWKLYARSDRYSIKRFEDETNLTCHLLVDLSRSMGFGASSPSSNSNSNNNSSADSNATGYSKADYARTVAATLATFLTRQRDAVGLMTFADTIGQTLPARFRPSHLRRLLVALEQAPTGRLTDVLTPLSQVAQLGRRRGLVVLIGDLLAPVEGLQPALATLRAQGHEVLVLRVLDRRELAFDFDKAGMFRDPETGREFYVDPVTAAAEYRRNFAAHADALAELTQSLGITLATLATDEPLDEALFELLSARMRQAGGSHRRGPR